MELEEDYSEYDDYMELERQWSNNAKDYDHDNTTEKDPLQGLSTFSINLLHFNRYSISKIKLLLCNGSFKGRKIH